MNRLITILLITSFFQLCVGSIQAQSWKRSRYEVNYGVGNTFFMGDLGGSNKTAKHGLFSIQDVDILSTRPVIFLAARYKVIERVALKLNFIYGSISANDKNTSDPGRNARALSFTSSIIEPSIQAELSILKERSGRKYSLSNIKYFKFKYLNTYVLFGAGVVIFDPKAQKEGIDIPQGTYNKTALSIPVGIGFKYGINRKWSFGIELSNRYTTSDFLDNHSDKYSKANDSYFVMLYQFTYKLKTTRSGLPKF
ncbi:MAG TPA: hypothetical protein DDX39_07845 [Bacteroidales bacterium]|nr:MAG: hypothetical protein A2W98_14270 [Bacteroidetes bacterium GWF2_33_38]HBF88538.1 hypothetical protein [Bacteroidales bacterium]